MKILYTFLFSIFLMLAISCNKEKIKTDDVLIITPEKVTSYARADWNSIVGQFQNKKGYLYTELNDLRVLAAISLPAKDPDAPAVNYSLLFNIDHDKRVTSVVLYTTDPLDIPTSNKVFRYYYDHAMSKLEGINYTWAFYQVNMPVEQLLLQIDSLHCDEASLTLRNNNIDMSSMVSHGGFSYILY